MIEWGKYGFEEIEKDSGAFYRKGFPLILKEENETLTVCSFSKEKFGPPYIISQGTIVANNQAVVLLLKAFNVPKNP